MLKAIHASEDREAARTKAAQVVAKLIEMKLPAAAALVRCGTASRKPSATTAVPSEHLRCQVYLARAHEPVPGNIVMWRGLCSLHDSTIGYTLYRLL